MIGVLRAITPYISGLYTLPWILVGFAVSAILSLIYSSAKIDMTMKKIGRIILYFFVPVLVFRVFIDTPLGYSALRFVFITCLSIMLMYLIAYVFARYQASKQELTKETKSLYIKTVVTNQGRSSAFVGGILLSIPEWGVPAAIFMAFTGIALFAIVPYILSRLNHLEQSSQDVPLQLPWFLRFYPWYFTAFVVAAVLIQKFTGITTAKLGDFGVVLRFYSALTIPVALYYVGSSMHISDMKVSELKKLLGTNPDEISEHWTWVRHIFVLTTFITPMIFLFCFGLLYAFGMIPAAWFVVIFINSILPITSTNMFLVAYGLDKKASAHAITWSTLICVPIVVVLIEIFSKMM